MQCDIQDKNGQYHPMDTALNQVEWKTKSMQTVRTGVYFDHPGFYITDNQHWAATVRVWSEFHTTIMVCSPK